MKRVIAVISAVLAVSAFAEDGWNTSWGSGWRLTVGPQFNFNASGRLGVKANAIPRPAPSYSSTKGAAQAAGDAVAPGNGRVEFPNGGFVDPSDAAGVPGETWNWHIPAGELSGGRMSFAQGYAEQSTVYDVIGGSARDDNWATGASFGLDRLVYRRGDFGVDVGFNFAFFLKNNWYKGAAGGVTRTDTTTTGSYITDVDMGNAGVMNDPWTQNPDGSYGGGTFDGPGPVISTGDISVSHRWGAESTSSSTTSYGPFSIRGDLQMYEFQLALKPWYELTDWFMVRGTLGLGLDYRHFDVKVGGLGKDSAHDWDCYMLCGLGGMFHWNNVCLGADFLRKVFDDDLDVHTRSVDGTIGNANWMFRVYIGYEF